MATTIWHTAGVQIDKYVGPDRGPGLTRVRAQIYLADVYHMIQMSQEEWAELHAAVTAIGPDLREAREVDS